MRPEFGWGAIFRPRFGVLVPPRPRNFGNWGPRSHRRMRRLCEETRATPEPASSAHHGSSSLGACEVPRRHEPLAALA